MKAKTTEKAPRKAPQAKRPARGEALAPKVAPEVGQPKDPTQRRAAVEAALARKKATTPAQPKPTAEEVIREMRAKQGLPAMPSPSELPDQKAKVLELYQRIHRWFNDKDKPLLQLEHWHRFADQRCDPAHLKDPKAARAPLAYRWVEAQIKHTADSRLLKAKLGKLRTALKVASKAARDIGELRPFQWGTVSSQEIVQLLGVATTWADQGLELPFPPAPKRGTHARPSTLVAEELLGKRDALARVEAICDLHESGEKEISVEAVESLAAVKLREMRAKEIEYVVNAIKRLGLEGDDFTSVALQKRLSKRRERKAHEEARQCKPREKKRRQHKPGT